MKKLVLTIGHSIVRTVGERWIPSEIYQTVERPNGLSGGVYRTFLHHPSLDPNADNVYLGGGQVVVKALLALWQCNMSADVAIIGGRPHHMDRLFGNEIATISEASVMSDYFLRIATKAGIEKLPTINVVEGTRNTEDDIREGLKLAQNFEQTTVIAMSFRLFRAQLLMKDVVQKNEGFAEVASRIIFRDAEQFLPEMFEEFVRMNQSMAYARTMSQEQHGVRAKLNGSSGDYSRTA